MSVKCLRQDALSYIGGGSDKVYVIQVQEIDTGAGVTYKAIGYYGRRGSTLSPTEKYSGPSVASANAAADKLYREKRGKGSYSDMATTAGMPVIGMPASAPVFGGASAASSPSTAAPSPRKPIVGIQPMLAVKVEEGQLESYLTDPSKAAQQKYDGERCVVSIRRGSIVATNRKGEERPLTQPVLDELTKLVAQPDFGDDRETVVDGEIMGDVYVIFDVMTLRDVDVRHRTFDERYAALEELLANQMGLLGITAWTETEKRAMLANALANSWEGLMFRDVDGKYITGRTSALAKHKLWAAATCRVLTANAQRSIQVALLDESDVEVFVGNVSVPVNQDIPDVDALVEVRYLYAHEGGLLYQPVLLGVRNDITEADKRSDLRKPPAEKRGGSVVTGSDAVAEAA